MPDQVWAPQEGDNVALKDGQIGTLEDIDTFVWQGGNEWQVSLTVRVKSDGEEDEELMEEVEITYDQVTRGWKEI